MANFDIFANSAFSLTSMVTAVDRLGYTPSFLYDLPGFLVPDPVRTQSIFIEERANGPALIQTDQRGDPPRRGRAQEKRAARGFKTARLSQASRIDANTLQSIR